MASISPSLILLLSLLSLATLLNFSAALGGSGGRKGGGGPIVGGWEKIKDPNDPAIKEIGEFAVSQHNKDAKESLSFKRVVSSESQVVSGTNYKLILAAKEGDVAMNYEALVYDIPWQHLRQLTSFKKV